MPQTPSTRWCPTPEQLMILEEMYKSGVRTPNASQIQQITAHLSFYGKIEGKNVFYWFQNHKARDRQKLRRRLSQHHQLMIHGNPPPSSSQFHVSLEDQAGCLSPTSAATYNQLFQQTTTPLGFLTQGVSDHQEAVQGLNLTCKFEKGIGSPPSISMMCGYDWMMMMESSSSNDAHDHQYCKTPKTLDLFPTKSTGLKDECTTSKSSSCSTSTN